MSGLPAFILLYILCFVAAIPFHNDPTQLVLSPVDWYDPRANGGRFLDYTTEEYGEPLNVIISALSDPFILTDFGFKYYVKSLGYSHECMNFHLGNRHGADLGDGDGAKLQQVIVRQYYFPILGTCWESLAGGQHFRAWKQNGTLANSGAWFIGASKEEDSSKHHTISPNGYNLGRDWLVARAVEGGHWKGMWWKANVDYRTDLLAEGSDGKWLLSLTCCILFLMRKTGVNHGIPQDGRVAILTVHRL